MFGVRPELAVLYRSVAGLCGIIAPSQIRYEVQPQWHPQISSTFLPC